LLGVTQDYSFDVLFSTGLSAGGELIANGYELATMILTFFEESQ
jgi:hypothetical protein